jgi:hypothetical protein
MPRAPGRSFVLSLVLGLAVTLGWGARAWGYEFSIDLRTIGQGYQLRRFAADGSNEMLSRRRLTQYLDLNVFDIAPRGWRGEDGDRNLLYVDISLRFDSDFGGYLVNRPTGGNDIKELSQSQIDILYAFVGGRNVGGRVDFQLGRQIHFDLLDFYAFDGGAALVRVARSFAVEGFAGTEVRGELPLSSPIYAIDGTSPGSRDPATRPEQSEALRPMAGGALVAGGDGQRWSARLAYRRIWSATVDRLPDEPKSGVNDEKLSLTASAAWRDRAFLSGGARFNLLLGQFDDEQLLLRFRVAGRQWLTLEHAYLAPSFDGDSIWNVFAAGAYRDLRAGYEVPIGPEVKAYARTFVRFWSGDDHSLGANLGAVWRRGRGLLRGDGYWDDGYGGRKVGLDLLARLALRPGFELEGRLTGYEWKSDLSPPTQGGVSVGAQAGGRYLLGPGVRLHVLAEDNVGTYYYAQFRGLAVIEVDASL